jgi:hypothetical protein
VKVAIETMILSPLQFTLAAAAAIVSLSTEAFTMSSSFHRSKSISRIFLENRNLGYSNNLGRDWTMDEPEPEVSRLIIVLKLFS